MNPAYPAYPGFETLRPEVQQAACTLAARNGGRDDDHARAWWEKLTPRMLTNRTPEEGIAGDDHVERHFVTLNSGYPHSAYNDRIDTDLAPLFGGT